MVREVVRHPHDTSRQRMGAADKALSAATGPYTTAAEGPRPESTAQREVMTLQSFEPLTPAGIGGEGTQVVVQALRAAPPGCPGSPDHLWPGG